MNVYKKGVLFCLLWIMPVCNLHANSSTDIKDVVEHTQIDQKDLQADNITPVIENYTSFIFEWGSCACFLNQPEKDKLPVYNFNWKALFTPNIAFLYAIRLNKSRSAFCLGFGYSTIAYAFPIYNDESYTLSKDGNCWKSLNKSDKGIFEGESVSLFRSSTLKISYIDTLLGFRFNTCLEDPKQGFFVWVGTKLGCLLNVGTTIKYYANGQNRTLYRGGFDNIGKVTCFGEVGLGYNRFGIKVGYNFIDMFLKSDLSSIRPLCVNVYVDLV